MLTDYQTYWVKIAVSETLEIDFGNNSGISESLKSYLIVGGAIFEDSLSN
jgi:hypothetical protein